MKVITIAVPSLFIFLISFCQQAQPSDLVIAKGRMPDITKDRNNIIYTVYGSGDSIMYISTSNGKSFTKPSIVGVLPKLFASAMRGPQIAATADGLIVTACTSNGNIYAYTKKGRGKWTKGVKVNDADESAKEALMDISADGLHAFAVWLGVKSLKGQNVYGAASVDGIKMCWSMHHRIVRCVNVVSLLWL